MLHVLVVFLFFAVYIPLPKNYLIYSPVDRYLDGVQFAV